MSLSTIDGDCRINGTLAAQRFNPPAGSITDAAIIASANIQATKVIQQFPIHFAQDAVVAETKLIHTVHGSNATVIAMDAIVATPATGADRTATIDLQKGNPATGFATILSAPVSLDHTTAARTPAEAVVSLPDLQDDDTLQIVVTVAGSAGAQAVGLLVTLTLQESPN